MKDWSAAVLLLLISGCTPGPAPGPTFHQLLLAVSREYKSYERFDGALRWAPFDCRAPRFDPQVAHQSSLAYSASEDNDTHGRKLYALFVKNLPKEYPWYTPIGQSAPIGQVIVKEAWLPEEVQPDTKKERAGDARFAGHEGKLFKAGKRSGLFIMMKLEPGTPDTDEGWVYGTVAPDGETVSSAGRVESCMNCHQKAPHDRLFGLAAK